MSGTTYKHYMDTKPETGDNHNLQISTRLKSLNALIVRPQRQELDNKTQNFCVSVGEGCLMNEYSFRIGPTNIPSQGLNFASDFNMGESYSELKKTFGVLGDYSHNNWINRSTFQRGGGATNMVGTPYSSFTACYGFEGFAKTAAESGINVSDRALPVTCEVKRSQLSSVSNTYGSVFNEENAATDGTSWDGTTPTVAVKYKSAVAENIRYDIFAVTDMIIYITADGFVSTRI